MIVSFRNAETEALASGHRVKRFTSIESVARRKLRQLQIAGRTTAGAADVEIVDYH